MIKKTKKAKKIDNCQSGEKDIATEIGEFLKSDYNGPNMLLNLKSKIKISL